VPPEEGEEAAATKPRHAGVLQWMPHLLALGGEGDLHHAEVTR
jgi:hypothetical protein